MRARRDARKEGRAHREGRVQGLHEQPADSGHPRSRSQRLVHGHGSPSRAPRADVHDRFRRGHAGTRIHYPRRRQGVLRRGAPHPVHRRIAGKLPHLRPESLRDPQRADRTAVPGRRHHGRHQGLPDEGGRDGTGFPPLSHPQLRKRPADAEPAPGERRADDTQPRPPYRPGGRSPA